MSRSTCWGARTRRLRRRCVRGSVAIEFAFILPLLLIFTIGVIEFGLILFDFHRAGEATRRALRLALINPPISAALNNLTSGPIVCNGGSSGVSCSPGSTTATADATFNAIVASMQGVFPTIQATNVRVTYSDSGLDAGLPPGLVTPLITVSLTGVSRPYFILNVAAAITGMQRAQSTQFNLPSFATTAVGPTQ